MDVIQVNEQVLRCILRHREAELVGPGWRDFWFY